MTVATPPDRRGDQADRSPLRVTWLALPGSRPWREPFWLSQMPGAAVTVVGDDPTGDPVQFVHRPYRYLTRRFVEAGALAWFRDLDTVPDDHDWVAALELVPPVTGQAAALARRRQSRLAVITWGNDARNPLYFTPPYRQISKRTRQAELVICPIEAGREHCIRLGIPAERCEVVHPGLDTELFHPPERPCEEPVLAFCSPLAPNKGIDRVLDALDLVRRKIPDARLVVAGRGPLEELVRQRAAVGDGAVELVGPRDRSGVAELLADAAVFVTAPRATPVWNEQFGMAYIEAMACGLPVVTTICGTSYEAVLAPNLRVPDRVEELADALVTFLENPALRREVGALNRRRVVERFELGQQVSRLRDAFDAHR